MSSQPDRITAAMGFNVVLLRSVKDAR